MAHLIIHPPQGTNSLLTGDGSEVCGGAGNTVDGLNSMDVCCNKLGRFVTIQVTDATNSLPLGKLDKYFGNN